jgi:hypothetical protein
MSLLEGRSQNVKEHCMLEKQGGEHLAFRTLISFSTSTNGIEELYSTTKKEALFMLHCCRFRPGTLSETKLCRKSSMIA